MAIEDFAPKIQRESEKQRIYWLFIGLIHPLIMWRL